MSPLSSLPHASCLGFRFCRTPALTPPSRPLPHGLVVPSLCLSLSAAMAWCPGFANVFLVGHSLTLHARLEYTFTPPRGAHTFAWGTHSSFPSPWTGTHSRSVTGTGEGCWRTLPNGRQVERPPCCVGGARYQRPKMNTQVLAQSKAWPSDLSGHALSASVKIPLSPSTWGGTLPSYLMRCDAAPRPSRPPVPPACSGHPNLSNLGKCNSALVDWAQVAFECTLLHPGHTLWCILG